MATKHPGIIEKTKGWEALCGLLSETTQVALAAKTGVRQSALSAIYNLNKKASLREALALAKVGIDPVLWAQPLSRRARVKGAA